MVRPRLKKNGGSHLSRPSLPLLSFRLQVFHPTTRIHVRLLGPCFKTGPISAFALDPEGLRARLRRPMRRKDNPKNLFASAGGAATAGAQTRGQKDRALFFLRRARQFRATRGNFGSTKRGSCLPIPQAFSCAPSASRGPGPRSAPALASKQTTGRLR
jgi:hypothetical protein